MKNLYILAFIAVFVITANAKYSKDHEIVSKPNFEKYYINGAELPSLPADGKLDAVRSSKSSNSKQGRLFNWTFGGDVTTSAFANWNLLNYKGSPLSYDPTLGDQGVVAMAINWLYRSSQDDQLYYDQYVAWSADGGESFTVDFVNTYDRVGLSGAPDSRSLGRISFGMTNTNQSQNPRNFDVTMTALNYDDNLLNGANVIYALEGGDTTRTVFTDFYPEVPNNNSGHPQRYIFVDYASSNAVGNSGIYGTSLLSESNDLSQYGYYGTVGIQTTNQSPLASVPENFWYDKFFHGESGGSLNRSALTDPHLDTDELGNVYLGATANNNLGDDQGSGFVPTVWKSTNNATNFGEANAMPEKIINDWVATKTAEGLQATEYRQLERFNGINEMTAFVVTGEDEYSLFNVIMPVATDPLSNDLFADEAFVIEYRYSGGAWSIHEVAQVNEWAPFTNYPRYTYKKIDELEKDFDDFSPGIFREVLRNFELEAARTADGENILVKFLDFRGPTDPLEEGGDGVSATVTVEPFTMFFEGTTEGGLQDTLQEVVTEIVVNDIFVAYRRVDEPGNWTDNNVSNDLNNYAGTHMPTIIPSLTNVPMCYSAAHGDPDTTPPSEGTYNSRVDTLTYQLTLIPREIQQLVNANYYRAMRMPIYDATTPSWATPANVRNDQESLGFEIKSLYPNPTDGMLDIVIETETAGFATIKAFDSMGKEVAQFFEGVLDKGVKGLPRIDLNSNNNFTTGNYYITLYKDGKSTTEILNVVK